MIDRAEEQLPPVVRIAGLLLIVLMAGCACVERAPRQTGATQGGAVAVEPVARPATPPQTDATQGAVAIEPVARPATPPQTDATQGAVAIEPVARPATPSTTGSTGNGVAMTDAPAAKAPARTPARVAASPAPAEQIAKKESTAPVIAKPASPPPLDLTSLEKRLRDTSAIGVFTKLTLKNQVDALLDQFRAHYQGRVKTTLAALRQPYDQLLLKLLSLLQDSDPSLAHAIATSREAIWGILSDPVKFSSL